MLVGEDLWKYLEERGVTRHEHEGGLMSCGECALVVATGKTKQELDQEYQGFLDDLAKEIEGLEK